MPQLSGEGSSLVLELTIGGTLLAGIAAAVIFFLARRRDGTETPEHRQPPRSGGTNDVP